MSGDRGVWRDGEALVAQWPAGVPTKGGRGSKHGGTLHLTTQRLVWIPLDVSDHPQPYAAWELELADVADVAPDPGARWATISLTSSDGTTVSYLVTGSRWAPLWSRKNRVALADAVAQITAAVAASS